MALVFFTFIDANAQTIEDEIMSKVTIELEKQSNNIPGKATVLVYSDTTWTGEVSGGDFLASSVQESGNRSFVVSCQDLSIAEGLVQKNTSQGYVAIVIIQSGEILSMDISTESFGTANAVADNCQSEGGGCLIATATYGSELAPQVQQLRELRDNKLLKTETGYAFIQKFNEFYYSFSPGIADLQRENSIFKETVKIVITPIISSLSVLNYSEMNSEIEVVSYGISLIILNFGMYVGIPVAVVVGIKKKFSLKQKR